MDLQVPHIAEREGEIFIKRDHIDLYGHVNNAQYLTINEKERAKMLEDRGTSLDELREETGLMIVAHEIKITFDREFGEGDLMHITTRVYPWGRVRLVFDQVMYTPGEPKNVHQITTCVAGTRINGKTRPQRFPQSLIDMLSKPLTQT